jgi:hypothetical protein
MCLIWWVVFSRSVFCAACLVLLQNILLAARECRDCHDPGLKVNTNTHILVLVNKLRTNIPRWMILVGGGGDLTRLSVARLLRSVEW